MLSQWAEASLLPVRRLFLRWVKKRVPAADAYTLTQRNLFVFPSPRAWVFLALIVVLWILGTNYQNNLVLALAFFMVSTLVIAIVHTYMNLSRLRIQLRRIEEAFADGPLRVHLRVANPTGKQVESVEFSWAFAKSAPRIVSIAASEELDVVLSLPVARRGWTQLPALRVQSVFPLGIVRCWTWLNFATQALVYPKPFNQVLGLARVSDDCADGLHPTRGGEDFSGLRQYAAGDPLRRINWKSFARGQGLFVKEFNESLSQELWLDYDSLTQMDREQRLAILCFWVLQYYQRNEPFGLNLPGARIPPNSGHLHRTHCLRALAEFGL